MSYLIYLTIWLYRYFYNGFDTVNHEGLWTILAHLGCPPPAPPPPLPHFSPFSASSMKVSKVRMRTMSHCRATSPSQTASSRGPSWPPPCSQSLFSITLREATEDPRDCTYLRFRTDGSLFNLRRLLAHAKTIQNSSLSCCLLWLRPSRPHGGSPAAHRQPLLSYSQEFRPHHQPHKKKRRTEVLYQPPSTTNVQFSSQSAHQESLCTATNEFAKTDHQPSQKFSFARNQPSSLPSVSQF